MATTDRPLAGAVRKQAGAQEMTRTALEAATRRRVAAEQEQRAAVHALHDLALEAHAEGLVPVQEILAITGLKESWFYQLRNKALKAKQEQAEQEQQ